MQKTIVAVVVAAALQTAQPHAQGGNATLDAAAKALGAKFVISTDSHHPKSFSANMPYGVVTARRGWLEAQDVMNTLPYDELKQALRKS